MLTTSQKIKESLLLTALNILLPSADIYFDVYFILRLNLGLHLSVITSLGSDEAESLLEQCNDFKFDSGDYKFVFNPEEDFEECVRNRTAKLTLMRCNDISFNTVDVEECTSSVSANSIYHVTS